MRSFGLPWSTQTNVMSKSQALKEYKRYIYAIVSQIAADVARVNFQVFKTNAMGKRVAMPSHPFLALMRRPNPDYTKFSFVELHQLYMELVGESFWYIVRGDNTKKPKYLKLLRPDMMEVAIGDKYEGDENKLGLVTGYVLTKSDGTKIPIDKKDIVHIKTPNPSNPNRGLSPLEAAVEYVKTEKLTSEFTMNSINNAGRPSGVLNVKGTIGDTEFKQVQKKFKAEYSGTSNAGKTLILNTKGEHGGVEFIKLGMEIGELALKDFKDVSRDDLMMIYRVSKTMMGITDDVNRASAKEAKSVWMENVIKPKMFRLVDGLDSLVATDYGTDIDLDFEDPAPKYLEDRTAEWTAGHNKWLTTNDIIRERNEFMGTEVKEIKGGDEMYQAINLIPVGDIPKTTPTDKTKPPEKTPAKKSLAVKKKELTRRELGEVFRSELFTRQKRWQSRYQDGVNKILGEQEQEILGRNKKAFNEWTFDPEDYKQKYTKLFATLGVELMKEQAMVALAAAGDNETVFEINKRVLDYINERVELFAHDFDQETIDALEASIGEGYQAGESIGKLRKRVGKIYDEAETVRSERVARTETIASSNEAALEAYKQSPLVVAQEWTTEPGACVFCRAMDGKIVGLETNFKNKGESVMATDDEGKEVSLLIGYTHLSHPPLHPNCECSILPVAKL